MRVVLRSALFSTIAFTFSLFLASCGSVSNPMVSNTPGNSGTGPVPTVSALATQVNGVAPNRKQEVQFSETMNPDTINAKTFLVKDAGGNQVTGTVTYDSDYNVAMFQPSPALENNTQYTATITTGAQSVGGMALAANYSYSFTTRADTDSSPITVTNVSPFPDENCVSPTTTITITFDEAPDSSTVTTSNIVVTDGSGNKIPISLSTNIATTQVVVTPKSALPAGSISVTVSGVADLADVPMQQPFTWTFSTACNPGGGGTGGGTNTAYVYADVAGSTNGSEQIYGWGVQQDGTLAPVNGSPFASNATTYIDVAQNFLFGANAGGQSITAWTIDSSGALTGANTSSTPWAGTASEGPFDISFDTTQKDLYANYSINGTYQAYTIGSNGSLSFINYVGADESSSWMSFTSNDAFGIQSACYHGNPGIFAYHRNADGSLSSPSYSGPPPQPTGIQATWCPWGAAALGTSNVIIAEEPTNDITPTGPWQMVNFAIAADGTISTSDTASSAPTVTVGDVTDYRFDSTQTWLAVGGSTGMQLFHWANGKLTSTGTFSVPNGVSFIRWDHAGHLFGLSSKYNQPSSLYVFNVVNGVLTPAPGSPVTVPYQGYGLAVKPLS